MDHLLPPSLPISFPFSFPCPPCLTFPSLIFLSLSQPHHHQSFCLPFSHKAYYCLAIAEDLIFRSLWTLNISVGDAGANILEGNILGTILAVMEIFRRFIWNYFRLENEHLNNCGQFRVVRDISIYPLNPSEVPLDDEEGVEPALRKHIQQSQRKLSIKLTEVGGCSLIKWIALRIVTSL